MMSACIVINGKSERKSLKCFAYVDMNNREKCQVVATSADVTYTYVTLADTTMIYSTEKQQQH